MIYMFFLFFTLLVLYIALYQWQFFMIFSPTYHREEELNENFEMLSVITDDGVELEGVVYEPKDLYRKLPTIHSTLLFFGGRSHDSVGLIKKLSLAFPHVRIITFNYRSYGKSGGSVNEKNIMDDGLKIAELIKKNYGDFYILGFSIGSSVASYVASKTNVLGVFLVGPFDSIALLAKEKYGVCLSWVLRYKFDNTEFVKNLDARTYVLVSKSDTTTYIENARNLKSHVKNLALYKEMENLTHKELLWDKEVLHEIYKVLK
ncbi:alpha/beta hydrolase [bacterium]|nr:alpha/beta hydrolase [bacterium]MBU1991169.1 alpha/beta hydrolase [bacterium]